MFGFSTISGKKVDRKLFEEEKSRQDKANRERLERYRAEKEDVKNKAKVFFDELLPMLDKFSQKHYKYNDQWGYSIEEIRKYENL